MPSKLINDLTKVPNIIADLGLGIANAQKQMNSGYLDALKVLTFQIARLTKGVTPGTDTAKFAAELLMNLAPPRYQFTQTELNVKLDLSQSSDVSVQAGLGFGMGAFVVNAAFAAGYSSDYRAAAECRTVIHAILPTGDNKALFDALIKRAGELDGAKLTLPDRSEFDNRELEATTELMKMLNAPPVPEKPADAPPAGGQ
jgi:hypothetical protein